MNITHRTLIATLFLISIGLSACSGGGGGNDDTGNGGNTDSKPTTVQEALDALGVNTNTNALTYPDGTAIPESEHPYGSTAFNHGYPKMELMLKVDNINHGYILLDDAPLYEGLHGANIPFRTPVSVAANTDGDSAMVALVVGVPGTNARPDMRMIETRMSGGVISEKLYLNVGGALSGAGNISQVYDMAAGDIDNDGKDEIAIVYGRTNEAVLVLLDDRDTSYSVLTEKIYTWNRAKYEHQKMRVDMGNVDRDGSVEIGVLISQVIDPYVAQRNATLYFIYDYETNCCLVEKTRGPLEAMISGLRYPVNFGDIVLDDIDGDGMDEVVMAGVYKVDFSSAQFIKVALDDAENNYSLLEADRNTQSTTEVIWEPYVEAWDPDGDGIKAIQVHGTVYMDFKTSGGTWESWYTIPSEFMETEIPFSLNDLPYKRESAAMAVGDLDQDGREELIFSKSNHDEYGCINVVNFDPVQSKFNITNTNGTIITSDTCHDGSSESLSHYPILLPVDIDGDASRLLYEGNHQVIYTEPYILAALAAAPCYSDPDIGQDIENCVTSFGDGQSNGTSTDAELSFTVGRAVGGEVDFFGLLGAGSNIEISATVRASLGWEEEIGQAVTYTGGPMTDSVIFSSVPYDQYFYRIVNDPVDSANNGKEISFLFPRTPKTLLVSKDFYNSNTPANAHKIGTETFSHTVGKPWSYSTALEADSWLDDENNNTNGLIATSVESLSQTGSIELEIYKAKTNTTGVGIEFNFTREVSATFGVSFTDIFGVGVASNTTWSTTETTAVAGSVGAITNSDIFSTLVYSWGLGMYPVANDSGTGDSIVYPVVNYWVE